MATRKENPTKLAARRKEVMAQIDALSKEKSEIDAKLLQLDLDKDYEGDGVVLSFTPVRNLDNTAIIKKFPAAKRPEFYKLSLDTTEFKKHFSAIELEEYQTISHRISVKEVTL